MFCGKGKKPHERSAPEVPGDKEADVILAGLQFTLTVKTLDAALPNEDWELVLESIRWWANFGGIGVRTRRGLGSVAINGIPPMTKDEIEKYGCQYRALGQTPKATSAWGKALKNYVFLGKEKTSVGELLPIAQTSENLGVVIGQNPTQFASSQVKMQMAGTNQSTHPAHLITSSYPKHP